MTTLDAALNTALDHWSGRPGSKVMASMASACVDILGAQSDSASVTSADAVRLLKELRSTRSAKTVGSYYGAFKRLLQLGGSPPKDMANWPAAPTAPRRTRDRMQWPDLDNLTAWFRERGWPETADLAVLLKATGLRVRVEALADSHLTLHEGDDFDTLHVVGKGGHERLVPVVDTDARALLADPLRLLAMRKTAYRTHLQRWSIGVGLLGIKSRLATPHSVRHGYLSEVLTRTGGNIALAQDLAGHANIATTAKYLHVEMASKAKAVGAPN